MSEDVTNRGPLTWILAIVCGFILSPVLLVGACLLIIWLGLAAAFVAMATPAVSLVTGDSMAQTFKEGIGIR